MIDKVTGPRLGADIDPDLITMWQAVSKGWLPPESITEEEYHQLRNSEPSPLKGYAAFALSYAGKKFGGWCRDSEGKRNYRQEAYNNAVRQFPKLRDVEFVHSSYLELEIPDGSIVYCDPPYADSTKYKSDFDHTQFWNWVRDLSDRCKVFVSEYAAPDDFECLWEKSVTSSLTQDTGSKRNIERLWRLKNE
jgi:DNA adenine methylase